MRKVIVFEDKAYGASKLSATEHTALLALDLAVGAVGIYGIPDTSTNNKEKMSLITESGSDAAGLVPDSAFDGPGVHIAVGTALGAQTSGEIDIAGVVKTKAQAYDAAVAQAIDITTVIPATVNVRDAATLRITDRENMDQGGAIRGDVINFSYSTNASDDEYLISAGIVAAGAAHPKQWVTPEVRSTTAGSVFANTATVTAVNGAVALVTSAAHGVGVGDFVRLGTDTYLAVTGTAASLLTLDHPYRGVTETVANANTKDLSTDAGVISINLTSLILGRNFEVSVMEIIEDSTIVYTTPGREGHGLGSLVNLMEAEVRGYKGSTAGATDATMPFEALKALPAATYDLYTFTVKNPPQDGTGATAKSAHNLYSEIVCAFPSAGSANGQSDFEKILGQLLYGAADLGDLFS